MRPSKALRHVPAERFLLGGPAQHFLVGKVHDGFELGDFGWREGVEVAGDEAAQKQVHLLDAAMRGAPEEALAADVVVGGLFIASVSCPIPPCAATGSH